MLYGCENWPLSTVDNRTERAKMGFLRKVALHTLMRGNN
jgi:hypothetical protein